MYEVCDNWNVRVAWIMQSGTFAIRRVSERVEPYLTDPNTYSTAPDGPDTTVPTRSLIDDYGPYTWFKGLMYPDGRPVPKNTWTKTELYFLSDGAPEQDPNLWATGLEGATYGSRVNLMICSDIFVAENQANSTYRQAQINWLTKTARTRLDGSGRIVFLGTRVASFDNYGALLDRWTANARVMYEDGYYTKYSNGFASVIIPAIDVNEDGEEESFWPTNPEFRLDSCLILDGVIHEIGGLTDTEQMDLAALGATRIEGLRDKRQEAMENDDDSFETTQMQRPPSDDTIEFTDEILAHPDDKSRTLGVAKPGEILIQGVDPARVAGAAWCVLGVDLRERTITFIDGRAHRKLGTEGIKENLILGPARLYQPAYLRFEANREQAVLDYPDVQSELKTNSVKVEREQTTGVNRNTDDYRVAKMVQDMRDGTLRWPTMAIEDRKRMALVKQHFKHWDERESAREEGRARPKVPDDLAMAIWIAWRKARELLDRRKPKQLRQPQRIPHIVRQRWGRHHPVDTLLPGPAPITDLAAAYFGPSEENEW